jgi:hypothetical protein
MTAVTAPPRTDLRHRIVAVLNRSDALAGVGAMLVALLVGALLIAVVGKDVPWWGSAWRCPSASGCSTWAPRDNC